MMNGVSGERTAYMQAHGAGGMLLVSVVVSMIPLCVRVRARVC